MANIFSDEVNRTIQQFSAAARRASTKSVLVDGQSKYMALLNRQWIRWLGELSEILNSALIVAPNILTSLEILSNKEWLDAV